MPYKGAGKGYTTDPNFGWVTKELGSKWLQWQQYATEWLAEKDRNSSERMAGIRQFLYFLKEKAPYAADVAQMFRGHQSGHQVSSKEFFDFLKAAGINRNAQKYTSYAVDLIDYILSHHLSAENDAGVQVPLFTNPLEKIKKYRYSSPHETVHSPLPYRYIQQLRHILCPYPTNDPGSKTPWIGFHFRDWHWAINNLQVGNTAWMEVPPWAIDPDDPDCISRKRIVTRDNKKAEIYEVWSPVVAMFLFTKLHLPLRSHQIRFMDSGEGDTWRYERGDWVENTKHSFKYGTPKRPYQKGIFRRIYDSISESYATGLYISTNKTADQNKDDIQRGYTIPWQHEELLYWLEKLRNWQEKYNPIDRLTGPSDLKKQHTRHSKTNTELKEMGEFAFLFRERGSALPMYYNLPQNPWYRLLSKLEEDVFKSGQTLSSGDRLKFVKEYDSKVSNIEKRATYFPLHSLRVSLITCYTMDTDLPLPVISKLLAGHTRLLMTIYYNKITPSVMAHKMKEADAALSETDGSSLRNFLADTEMRQIPLRAAFHNDQHNSVESVLANRNPIGWEERATGLCLVGGNTVHSDELSTVGGCWNGGAIVRDSEKPGLRVYGPVPHGPENCPRCRWHITDATYLPALNSAFNQVSYKAHQAAEQSVELEGQLEALKDELFIAEETGAVFLKHNELQALERRYEKQRVEADEYAKDYIAIFNLINRVIQIENGREEDDDGQKLIAVGSDEDLKYSMKFVETDSELLHLALLCEDAEFYPDLHDDLRKTPAIAKRTNALSRMMARSGYKPVFLEMDEQTQLIAGNALMRKMAKIAAPEDRLEGYRIASNYIEAQEFLKDDRLLKSGFDAVKKIAPITLHTESVERIPALEVEE